MITKDQYISIIREELGKMDPELRDKVFGKGVKVRELFVSHTITSNSNFFNLTELPRKQANYCLIEDINVCKIVVQAGINRAIKKAALKAITPTNETFSYYEDCPQGFDYHDY